MLSTIMILFLRRRKPLFHFTDRKCQCIGFALSILCSVFIEEELLRGLIVLIRRERVYSVPHLLSIGNGRQLHVGAADHLLRGASNGDITGFLALADYVRGTQGHLLEGVLAPALDVLSLHVYLDVKLLLLKAFRVSLVADEVILS